MLETKAVAVVRGCVMTDLPQDLYIPPDALEIFLEAFEGPLDLLLYLIRKQNLDVLDIPIAEITRQYQQYIELMQGLKLELAAEYLLMAAMLAEIKSRLLLPRLASTETGEEEDPRAELVRRLQEYEQFKQAAELLDNLPRVERDIYTVAISSNTIQPIKSLPIVTLQELQNALTDVINRANWRIPHLIQPEVLSIRERMGKILERLSTGGFVPFHQLLEKIEGRLGVVVTLMAILELLKQTAIEIAQADPYAPIHVTSSFSHKGRRDKDKGL